MSVCRCLTIATSDSGGGAGIQADLKAFAAAGCHGTSALVTRLFPLATVVTPNLMEAQAHAGRTGTRRELAEAIHDLGAPAVVVTGGHGDDAVDHLFDGAEHHEIPVQRHDVAATHGAGC